MAKCVGGFLEYGLCDFFVDDSNMLSAHTGDRGLWGEVKFQEYKSDPFAVLVSKIALFLFLPDPSNNAS